MLLPVEPAWILVVKSGFSRTGLDDLKFLGPAASMLPACFVSRDPRLRIRKAAPPTATTDHPPSPPYGKERPGKLKSQLANALGSSHFWEWPAHAGCCDLSLDRSYSSTATRSSLSSALILRRRLSEDMEQSFSRGAKLAEETAHFGLCVTLIPVRIQPPSVRLSSPSHSRLPLCLRRTSRGTLCGWRLG